MLESTRETVLHNSTRLANRLEVRLEGLQGQLTGMQSSLSSLLQGQVPITFTGYFGVP